YRHRARLGPPDAELSRFAAEAGLGGQYLSMIWSILTEAEAEVGPLAVVRKMWHELPAPSFLAPFSGWGGGGTGACERMRDLVLRLRRQLVPKINRVSVKGISDGSQPLVLWRNRQLASRHRSYLGEVFPDFRKLAQQLQGVDAGLAELLAVKKTDA